MNILIGFLIAVEVIVSVLLILIVLVQPSKSGGGLGGAAFGGGGMGEQLFGARAGNVLTKGTVLFAVIFLVNTMALALVYSKTTGVDVRPAPASTTDALPQPQDLMGLPEAPLADEVEDLTEEAEEVIEDAAADETEAELDDLADEAEDVIETVEEEIEETLEEEDAERTED
ncbi:MAG: preprotein translocase subunit SecG [Verrucomicrobia bacterium]|nr:preprotein translocase subunit SecG [Verrucomicrobiota bacterium]